MRWRTMGELLFDLMLAVLIIAAASIIVVMPIVLIILIGEWLWDIFKRR